MHYWLMKSEPSTYSFDHLMKAPKQMDHWEGVRNYQARNFMRDRMRIGDKAFFYHSNCQVPGIVGIMEVVRESYPDVSALNPDSPYYDPKSTVLHPRWFMVDVRALKKLKRIISLVQLKTYPPLQNMMLLKPGNRLSIMPVTVDEWQFIMTLAEAADQ